AAGYKIATARRLPSMLDNGQAPPGAGGRQKSPRVHSFGRRPMHALTSRGTLSLLVAVMLVACAASAPGPTSVSRGSSEQQSPIQASGQPAGPKRIVAAVVGQPLAWVERLRGGPRVGAWNL